MQHRRWPWLFVTLSAALVWSACSTDGGSDAAPTSANPAATPQATEPAATEAVAPDPNDLSRVRFSTSGWETDFTQNNVDLRQIASGGPPKDGIPSIDNPKFIPIAEADSFLDDRESVQIVEIAGDARAYPTQILIWHEIVNDEVGGVPLSVTFCPLCNTAIVFERTIPEVGVVEFGVSGNLYNSAMIMYDRTTETWFWQVSGEGVVGELTGHRLTMVPSNLTSWAEFKRAHPDGQVLSWDTGFARTYGMNPYVGYDSTADPFLFEGSLDGRLHATERVATVEVEGHAAAFPFSSLVDHPVIPHTIAGQDIVVFYQPGTASPLDAGAVAQGRDVGSTGVYRPIVDGQQLTFEWDGEAIRDTETGSRWTLLGEATAGPLTGARLDPVVHGNHFWFSWAVYRPDTEIVRGE